jgi:hypothetical protein
MTLSRVCDFWFFGRLNGKMNEELFEGSEGAETLIHNDGGYLAEESHL